MRSPIRLKNLRWRFLPFYVAGLGALLFMRPAPLGLWLGCPAVLVGVSLRSWGAGHLLKNHQLSLGGPYAHLRHPLYAGSLLIGAGFCLIAGGWVSLALLALLVPWFFLSYFPRKERVEAERLSRLYGERFARYRKEVPPLWPRLSAWRAMGPDLAASSEGWSRARYRDNNELGAALAVVVGLAVFAWRGIGAG